MGLEFFLRLFSATNSRIDLKIREFVAENHFKLEFGISYLEFNLKLGCHFGILEKWFVNCRLFKKHILKTI
ncbi:hypothetical protein B0A65_00440 [Flavobacterium frigidimaris]|uniref:Uncharacterized protein n=1 Tax=Flavobacterium frigidimaris TaxID=262320 RepID=A0ABX4BWG2_FLAFR|nr:hypothetical protein B0A65_00440 [Flavobacterium frigidimaris]